MVGFLFKYLPLRYSFGQFHAYFDISIGMHTIKCEPSTSLRMKSAPRHIRNLTSVLLS
jgi:hypothetical protein